MSAPDPAARYDLHARIQGVVEGWPLEIAMAALMDSLAGVIGVSCGTLDAAAHVAEPITNDLKRIIAENWTMLQAVRAGMLAEKPDGPTQ